jgi:hypothetical protein
MPVEIDDLAVLVRSKPGGRVSTKLAWEVLDAEDFERLLFNIVSDAEGYANPKWLTRTNAPDRGRDISVDRGLPDFLSGVMRQRIIIEGVRDAASGGDSVQPPAEADQRPGSAVEIPNPVEPAPPAAQRPGIG